MAISRTKRIDDNDKDIVEIRQERDDCAALLRRMIYATRPGQTLMQLDHSRLRLRAEDYLKRKGLNGSPIR